MSRGRNAKELASLLAGQAVEYEMLDEAAAKAAVHLWWNAFSSKESPDRWLANKLWWHCFSHQEKPALQHEAAIGAYEAAVAEEALLFSVMDTICVAKVRKRAIPFSVLRCFSSIWDLYVMDTSATWTFARTHEDACKLGPYFSRREWRNSAAPRNQT